MKTQASGVISDGGEEVAKPDRDEQEQLTPSAQEEIQSWQLRFQFTKIKFGGPVWQGLQDAGWTHNSRTYFSPKIDDEPPLSFDSSYQLCEYMDRFCIPDITNTLQLPPENPLSGISSDERWRGQELRNEAIRHIYRRMPDDKATTEETAKKVSSYKEGPAVSNQLSRRSTRGTNFNTATAFEKGADIFLRKSRGVKSVSTQDIAFLKFPDSNECVQTFRDYPTQVIDEIEEKYRINFDDWMFLLTTQNSLLLSGFGSKRHLLESFANKLEQEGDVLTVDGFDRDVRIESILDVIVDNFLDGEEPLNDNHEHSDKLIGMTVPSMIATHGVVLRAIRIAKSLAVKQRNRRCPLFFVLHNIDGPMLRSQDIQEALAALVAYSTIVAGVNTVRLVASVDHVNASALLWNTQTSANFSWIWKEVHTYRPYVEELSVGVLEDHPKTNKLRKAHVPVNEMDDVNMLNVLTSLSPRHTEVLTVLATLQLENSKPVDHTAILQNCKHKMIVSNDTTLRSYIAELVDHEIVETGKDSTTGREWLRIPLSREKLQEIINFDIQSGE
jgi:origin recognition complex subunit 2